MKSLCALLMASGLLFTCAPVSHAAEYGSQWERFGGKDGSRDYRSLRGLVNQTQEDLRASADLETRKGDSRNRYADAQGHLSTFDRKLTRGKFDSGELKKSIDKIRQILDKNVLQGNYRDALRRDLSNLELAASRNRY